MTHKNNLPPSDNQDDEFVSKTQKKQMVHELQDLAKHITQMPKKKIQQLDLPQTFLDAITESKRITSHIARKRHFQYMGKLLLKDDHEAIRAKLEQVENSDGHYQVRDAVINLWIEQFSAHEKALFDHLYQHHDNALLSTLRQTLRNYRKSPESSTQRKKLFQALRQLDQQAELPNPLTVV